jgi:hypothetical protein
MGRVAWVVVFGLALVGLPTSAAAGDHVEHEKLTLNPEVLEFGAGEACDFAVRVETTDEVNQTLFYDEQGSLVRIVAHIEELNRVVNLETGYALDERIHTTLHMDLVTGEHVETGNLWHLRDAEGHIVYVGAGRVVIDMATGEVLEATPNTGVAVGLPLFVSLVETNCRELAGPTAPN